MVDSARVPPSSVPSTRARSVLTMVRHHSSPEFMQCIQILTFFLRSFLLGSVVGDWCPFPPFLGPVILGNLAPPEKVATFPVRAKGNNIEVFVDRNLKERFESKYWAGLLDAKGKATGEYY